MRPSRRGFIQASATAAAAITLGPLDRDATAEATSAAGRSLAEDASIKAFEEKMMRARPVPLNRVRVLGGPLKQAQDVTAKYLLELEPDRMMAYYRVRAGLTQKAQPYGGWDGGGRNLTGHIAGHHLSAVSLMYLATGDARFKARADYLVRELREVQDKNGDGYLSALEGGREAFAALSKGEIRTSGFDLNGLWSPWYTLHKTFAGLRDAYRHTGNKTALSVELKYAAWSEGVLAPLTDTQVQKSLNTEHGGMNEVLADLYADTGDKRWLALSLRFEHHAFTDPLKRHQDNLSGKHGNCQIPKLIGSATRYGYTGDPADLLAASFFWDRVAQHHSYATGGHGLAEYFGAPDQLSARVDGRTCETCNCYNMLKLTRRLFSLRPDATYADFHERTLFNHILASIDPEDGRTSYMVPVGRGVQQEYQDMLESFTCCVGTGMESHALHGLGIYYESADTVWVNLFVPSSAQLTTAGARLTTETGFPDGDSASIALTLPAPKEFTLAVRRPAWAGDGFEVRVNGARIEQPPLASLFNPSAGGRGGAPGNEAAQVAGSYVEIKRTWSTGDKVELTLPKSVRLEATPDNRQVAAIMWGPLVLAGDLGPRRQPRVAGPEPAPVIPMLVAADRPVADWVVPATTRTGDFRAQQVARVPAQPASISDVSLTPFYRTHRRTYSVYFDVLTPAEFQGKSAAYTAERERQRRLEAATVSFVQPGDRQAEQEYNYQSDPADRRAERTNGRGSRGGPGWFSLDMPVEPTTDMAVVVTYFNELGLPPTPGNFDVLVEGAAVAHFEPDTRATGFHDARYAVPAAASRGKA
ncbi:MAG: beta-L-arabinofuranosidase domain-containing protein, partial [Gemmatimonadales bacterium]